MSVSLAEALGQVDLEPGQVFSGLVNGHWVELRVTDPSEREISLGQVEAYPMLDPWVELPQPKPRLYVEAHRTTMPLPDPPEIPEDWDHE